MAACAVNKFDFTSVREQQIEFAASFRVITIFMRVMPR